MRNHLLAIGIMTGNSLDGADLVLSSFGLDGGIEDIHSLSVPFPDRLKRELRAVRAAIHEAGGRVDLAVDALGPETFNSILGRYTALLDGSVADLRAKAGPFEVDLIGLHGQTCAHYPPSVAGGGNLADVHTVQVGDGQALADLTETSVVYDFRSDDLMAGGEGAPLAPVHHRHLAESAKARGAFPIAFCNGGNTGNISLISGDSASGDPKVLGWDTGPFNHFPDRLMQLQLGRACDQDAEVGRRGAIHLGLLSILFHSAVSTRDGENFLLRPPPKSSDPDWYRLPPELVGEAPVGGPTLSIEDRVRTATYFASYAFCHSLALIPAHVEPPTHFAVCGGGWRNPLALSDFRALLAGRDQAPILPEHADLFGRLRAWTANAVIAPSETFGFDGTAMEARIFADAAVSRIKGEPFTLPATTGVAQPTVCGIIRFPRNERSNATQPLQDWLNHFKTEAATIDHPDRFDPRWSRASARWQGRLASCISG